jgi:hypothetical protein
MNREAAAYWMPRSSRRMTARCRHDGEARRMTTDGEAAVRNQAD